MWAAATAVLALLVPTGCQLVGGPEDGQPDGSDSSAEGSGDTSGGDGASDGPATIPPQLLECGDPSTPDKADQDKGTDPDSSDDGGLLLTDTDLTTASWSMPDGFQEAFGYVEDNPVETLDQIWVAEPTDSTVPSLNVVNVVVYTGLDWGPLASECAQVPLDAVEERLAGYRDQIGAEPLTDAQMTEVAGLPAITQEVGLDSYDYVGYWLFSRTDLVHVYCQWTDAQYRPVVEDGCADLVASVRVG